MSKGSGTTRSVNNTQGGGKTTGSLFGFKTERTPRQATADDLSQYQSIGVRQFTDKVDIESKTGRRAISDSYGVPRVYGEGISKTIIEDLAQRNIQGASLEYPQWDDEGNYRIGTKKIPVKFEKSPVIRLSDGSAYQLRVDSSIKTFGRIVMEFKAIEKPKKKKK